MNQSRTCDQDDSVAGVCMDQLVGAAVRVHGSFVVTHWIRCLLFGIQPNNPAILPEAAVLLLAAAFVMGLDCRVPRGPGPMVALRYE